MKTYWRNGGRLLLFLTSTPEEMSGQLYAPATLPLVPIKQEPSWATLRIVATQKKI
jgi:hypothetical protein